MTTPPNRTKIPEPFKDLCSHNYKSIDVHEHCDSRETHYVETDGLGYYHSYCDEHDPRPLFQENRVLRAALRRMHLTGSAISELVDAELAIADQIRRKGHGL